MWKFNKTTLFIIMLTMSICAGISFSLIDWDVFSTGKGIFNEIHLPLLFIGLSIFFMVPYIKTIKEGKKE